MLTSLTQTLNCARQWLTARLAPVAVDGEAERRLVRRKLFVALAIFLVALGVRWLHLADARVEAQQGRTMMTTMGIPYRNEATRMLNEGGVLLPRSLDEATDARMIVHPPGYAMLIAALQAATGDGERAVIALQIVADAAAAVMVFLIAAELLPAMLGLIAGLLVAFSPHLSYYALWLSPDSLAVLPILFAIWLLVRLDKRPRWVMVIAAGAMLGASCWLRANALLLAPLLALVVLVRLDHARRWRYAAAFVVAAIVIVSPITIRNYVIYHRVVPLSLGAGITMIEGIGDYDRERRFDMPRTDDEVAQAEARWHGRADYAVNLWSPDGIERDRERMRRGFAVARAHPAWFAGTMLRRALWMMSSNDTRPHDWPFNTAVVPIISSSASFSHSIQVLPDSQPIWLNASSAWLTGGELIAPRASAALAADSNTWRLAGDDSIYNDQFMSAPLAVKKNTDYVLRLSVRSERETLAAKVSNLDRRLALASTIIPAAAREMNVIELPFASGAMEQVRVVLSNNGGQAIADIGAIELYETGPTGQAWTRWLRPALRGVQKNLYTTGRLLTLELMGLMLVVLARRWQLTITLLAVPLYYLFVQSALHTEYRYILAIHDFLFIFAAVALYIAGAVAAAGLRRALARTRRTMQSYRAWS